MEILSSAPHTLHLFAEYACAAIEFISIIIILCGVAAAIARGLRLALSRRRAAKNEWLHLRLSLEETLMLGLQFLMAADIIGTISNPDLQGVIVLTVIAVFIVLMFPLGIILPILAVVLDVFMFRRLNVEYEYLFVNGDLDVDKIMSRAKRKRMFSMNVSEMELLAPSDAPELRQYQNAKTLDFSSGTGQAKLYTLVVADHGELKKVVFEPNETIIEGFFVLAPRKVIRK